MRALGRIRTLARGAFAELPGETSAVVLTMIALIAVVHGDGEGGPAWAARVFCAGVPVTPLLLALTILRKADRIGRTVHLAIAAVIAAGTYAAVACGISTLSEVDELVIAIPYLAWLVVAVAAPLVVTWVAAPAGGRETAFARFIAKLISAAVSVTLIAGAAVIAVVLLAYAMNELFDVSNEKPMLDLFALIGGASALVLLHDVRPVPPAAEQDGAIPRVCRRLVTLVGAPFVAAMFAIVILYEITVLVGGELPSNVLGPLLVGTGVTGFACALIIQSMLQCAAAGRELVRQVGEGWERSRPIRIVRVLPLILVAVLPLAMWGLTIRIDQHGFTPERVVAMYMLIGLVVLAVAGTVRLIRRRGPLSWEIPACAALFALATGFGPLSAIDLSISSQRQLIEAELAALGVSPGGPTRTVDDETYYRLTSRMAMLDDLGARQVAGVRISWDNERLEPFNLTRRAAWSGRASRRLDGAALLERPPGRVMSIELPSEGIAVSSPDGAVEAQLDETNLRFRLGDRRGVLDIAPIAAVLLETGQLVSTRFALKDSCGQPFGELVLHSMLADDSPRGPEIRDLRASWLLPADENLACPPERQRLATPPGPLQ